MTAVEWLGKEIKKFNTVITKEYLLLLIEQAEEMEREQSHKYAEFVIRCDRMGMKILNFQDWIKLETFKKQ